MYGLPASYDRWRLSEPEYARPVARCAQCKDDIYEGDEIYRVEGDEMIHPDCFEEYAKKVLDPWLDVA